MAPRPRASSNAWPGTCSTPLVAAEAPEGPAPSSRSSGPAGLAPTYPARGVAQHELGIRPPISLRRPQVSQGYIKGNGGTTHVSLMLHPSEDAGARGPRAARGCLWPSVASPVGVSSAAGDFNAPGGDDGSSSAPLIDGDLQRPGQAEDLPICGDPFPPLQGPRGRTNAATGFSPLGRTWRPEVDAPEFGTWSPHLGRWPRPQEGRPLRRPDMQRRSTVAQAPQRAPPQLLGGLQPRDTQD